MSEIVFRSPDDDCYYPADTDRECWGYERFQIFPADQQMVLLAEVLAIVERRIKTYELMASYSEPSDAGLPAQLEAEAILRRLREEFNADSSD